MVYQQNTNYRKHQVWITKNTFSHDSIEAYGQNERNNRDPKVSSVKKDCDIIIRLLFA